MMMRVVRGALSLSSVLLLDIHHGCAANLSFDHRQHCGMQITGDINSGDTQIIADRLVPILKELSLTDPIDHSTICFDSDGGSYPEGWKLFTYIKEHALSTFVESGKRCLSACAIAFLGGTIDQGDGDTALSRTIEKGAILGFLAPFADFEDRP